MHKLSENLHFQYFMWPLLTKSRNREHGKQVKILIEKKFNSTKEKRKLQLET